MEERQLKRLCIAGSLLSLLCIFILSHAVQPEEADICSLSAEYIGKVVSVGGTVTDTFTDEGNVFFTLAGGGCEVRAVLWNATASAMSLRGEDPGGIAENAAVKITGSVEVYRGNIQIVVLRPSLGKP